MRRTNSSLGIVLAICLLALGGARCSAQDAAPAGGAADESNGSANAGQQAQAAAIARRLATLELLGALDVMNGTRGFLQTPEMIAQARAIRLARANALQERITGDRLFHEGKVSEAEGHYRHSVKLDDHDPYARTSFARCLSRLGKWRESAAVFKHLLADRSSIPAKEAIVGCEYALVLLKLGYWDTACEAWDQAMRDTVSVPDEMRNRADNSGSTAELIAYQNTHRRLSEERFAPYNLRKKEMEALCEWILGTQRPSWEELFAAEKLAHLQAAVKANPKLPEAQYAYGKMLVDQRHFAEAKLALKVAFDRGNPLLKKEADWLLFYCDHPAPPKVGEPAH